MSGLAAFRESGIRIAKVDDSFYNADNCRNSCPAEHEIQDSLSDFTHIELVDTQVPEKNCEDGGGHPVFR